MLSFQQKNCFATKEAGKYGHRKESILENIYEETQFPDLPIMISQLLL